MIYRVFITEDDLMYRKMLTYLFKTDKTLELHVFENGQDCLDKLSLQPDIVLLDYTLPDYSGEEMLLKLKATNKRLKVVVLSGIDDIELINRLLELGAYDFIPKDKYTKIRVLNTLKHLKGFISLTKI